MTCLHYKKPLFPRSPSELPHMIGNKMEWLSKIPMPDSDNGQLCKEEDGLSDSGNDGNDEDSLRNGANDDARARRKSFASFASKTLSLRSARNGSMDVSVSNNVKFSMAIL